MDPRTVLVLHDGGPDADHMLRIACDTIGTRGGRVVVLALTEVHRTLPLADLPTSLDEPGRRALHRAEVVAGERGVEIEPRLRRTYNTAQAIVREARAVQADAIFLPLRPPRLSWLPLRLGGTAREIMGKASCPVILGYVPPITELDAPSALAEAQWVLNGSP